MRNKQGDSTHKESKPQPAARERGRLRRHWRPALAILVVLALAVVWWNPFESAATAAPTRAESKSSFIMGPGNLGPGPVAEGPRERAERIAVLKNQVELAEQTLCSYQAGTKYPHESRPINEHPDQVYPNQPIEEVHAMRLGPNKADAAIQIKSSQSRVFVASGESVGFSIKAFDRDGKVQPLFVTRAVARGIVRNGSRDGREVTLAFADAGGGAQSATLTPSSTSFADYNGSIRIEVKYNVGDRSGFTLFDVVYTSEVPAVWAGRIREAVEDGSLNFYLKADVRLPGRYLVNGRVDDAGGKPFALVTFNDVLAPGPNDIKLTVFGKLIRDQQPVFPLTLRDVDAHLLKENADPDRALMARMVGPAFITKTHAAKNFSDAEWQSEERSRHLTEFGKDVNAANGALAKLDPSQEKESGAQVDCRKVGEAKSTAG